MGSFSSQSTTETEKRTDLGTQAAPTEEPVPHDEVGPGPPPNDQEDAVGKTSDEPTSSVETEEVTSWLRNKVCDYPLTSLAVAAGAGFFIK